MLSAGRAFCAKLRERRCDKLSEWHDHGVTFGTGQLNFKRIRVEHIRPGGTLRTAGGHANAAARDLRGAVAYAIRAARAAAPESEREAAGRVECQWQPAE